MISLPHRRNAIKALRKHEKRHLQNLDIKTDIRKTIKKFQDLITQKNAAEAKTMLYTLYKKFDKAAKDNIIHKNTVARRKSRFSRLLAKASKA